MKFKDKKKEVRFADSTLKQSYEALKSGRGEEQEILRKYKLNQNWRLVYTLVGTDLLVVSIILDWYDHKEYEKRFGF